MNERLIYRVWDKQEKLYIENIGVWRNCWMANDLDLPENYYDTFEDTPNIVSGFDDSICVEITDRFVVEQCTGMKDGKRKLIFEGDKIKAKNGKIWLVRWNRKGGFELSAISIMGAPWKEILLMSEYFDNLKNHGLNLKFIEVVGSINEDK